jgi:tetratricopeptide (TPR) repeat protein
VLQNPKSPTVYDNIGNFWRIKGDTQASIECFRKALSIAPNNPHVLLNLARVLFNLQYLDDAIALTRQSLKMQSPEQNSWQQHFTLGEILKAYGHFNEAALHFRHALDLNPNFAPAESHLREMEVVPDATVTYYTLCIILFLVLGVLCGILTSIDAGFDELGENVKTQRHFNRAMAMRSIKLGINPKLIRMRKQMNC